MAELRYSGCRLPGECYTPSEFWDLLIQKRSAHSAVPKNRFNVDGYRHENSQRQGSVLTTGGYFLSHDDHHKQFDSSFFGINPVEAASMDPQQRKLLECVYECFESAGACLEDISGSDTACYVGCFTKDFELSNLRDMEDPAPYQYTGRDQTILSNRVNYAFNLKGPSMTVNTACSSSLYALHLACQSLILGDCEAAVVGGANMVLDIDQQMGTSKLGILGSEGECHTFDDRANGYGRSDGITAIYIKRLADAVENGDPIRGIIRSTAVNSNGRGSGINRPEASAQEAVIRKAYTRAGLDFDNTGYFEMHGTGTPVGDPIECTAVGNVFAGRKQPLLIGSVKTNIGHTEGASGLASVIKCCLALEAGIIPPSYGVKNLNPKIDFRNLQVVRKATQWPKQFAYRRTSINSFGYGGANSHVIIDAARSFLGQSETEISERSTQIESTSTCTSECSLDTTKHSSELSSDLATDTAATSEDGDDTASSKHLLVFSAHDEPTLHKNIDTTLAVANEYVATYLAFTLSEHRSRFKHRAFVIADTEDHAKPVTRTASGAPGIAFAFTGQGAQWPQMGYSLLSRFSSCRRTLRKLEEALKIFELDWTIKSELSKSNTDSRVYKNPSVAVILSTAVQIILVDLLAQWEIKPKAVVGHSSGEIAAAYAAGFLKLLEAMRVAYNRALAIAKTLDHAVKGCMLAVGRGAEAAETYLVDGVSIACHNSPESVTLSGRESSIDMIATKLKDDGIFARKLPTSGVAYHSHLVEPARAYFAEHCNVLIDHRERQAACPMYSDVTMKAVVAEDVDVEYWAKTIPYPACFNQAFQEMVRTQPEINMVIEIGPHSALSGPIRQIRSSLGMNEKLEYLPSILRGRNNVENMLDLAGQLFLRDYPINLRQVNSNGDGFVRTLHDLPRYQWNYGRAPWIENRISNDINFRRHQRHDLLGSRLPGCSAYSPIWRNVLYLDSIPWLRDHKMGNDVIFPAAGYISMVFEAVSQIAIDRGVDARIYNVKKIKIHHALILQEDHGNEILLDMRVDQDVFEFIISSVTKDGKWSEHATGSASYDTSVTDVSLMPVTISKSKKASKLYTKFEELGMRYGTSFQTLRATAGTMASIALQSTKSTVVGESQYAVHPTTIDGALQFSAIAVSGQLTKPYLPVELTDLVISKEDTFGDEGILSVDGSANGFRQINSSFRIANKQGNVLISGNVSFLSLEGGLSGATGDRQPYTKITWEPSDAPLKTKTVGQPSGGAIVNLIYGDNKPDLDILEASLGQRGYQFQSFHINDSLTALEKGSVAIILEIGQAFLVDPSNEVLKAVQHIVLNVRSAVWVTENGQASQALMPGIVKTIMSEQPSFRVSCVAIDELDTTSTSIIVDHVGATPGNVSVRNGVAHAPYYKTDDDKNEAYLHLARPKLEQQPYVPGLQLSLDQQLGIHFKQIERNLPGAGEILVQPIAYTVSKQDAMTLRGQHYSPYYSHEFFGVVTRAGNKLSVGDHVIGIQPGKFESEIVVKEDLCVKATRNCLGSILPLSMAVHALENLARMRSGDRIVIDVAESALELAARRVIDRAGGVVVDNGADIMLSDTLDVSRTRKGGIIILTSASTATIPAGRSITVLGDLELPRLMPWVPRLDLDLPVNPITNIHEGIVDCTGLVPVAVGKPLVTLDPYGWYLLAGCSGGLGQSIVQWMRDRGARNFIDISRTYGFDLTKPEDVARAVAGRHITGVVNAAAVFCDAFFVDTDIDTWRAVTAPKIQGSLNLQPYMKMADWTVLTSSTIGHLNTQQQCAYTAANTFMDALAGGNVTSLSLGLIGGIGHVEENPIIAEYHKRLGNYYIDEEEFLANFECAVRAAMAGEGSHIITGMDPSRTSSVGRFFEVDSAMGVAGEGASIQDMVVKKLEKLLQTKVSLDRKMGDYGVDSLISGELRSWAWKECRSEVGFMELLDGRKTVGEVVDLIERGVQSK